jgi:hypothetical protein
VSGSGEWLPRDEGADPGAGVEAILAGLDDTDQAANADIFEAVNDAILAELRRLEAL